MKAISDAIREFRDKNKDRTIEIGDNIYYSVNNRSADIVTIRDRDGIIESISICDNMSELYDFIISHI